MLNKVVIATLVFALQFKQGNSATTCATPGMYLSSDNQYCFGLGKISRTWNFHSIICQGYNAKIINIDSQGKQTLVETFLKDQSLSSSDLLFIGLTNIIGDTNNWVWFGGNITSFDNWGNSEPTDSYRFNCAYMKLSDYKWYSSSCLSSYYGMCEREATSADIP